MGSGASAIELVTPSSENPRSDTFSGVKAVFTFTPLGGHVSFMAKFQK